MTKNTALAIGVARLPALPPEATRSIAFLGQALLEPASLLRLVGSDSTWAAQVLRQAQAPLWGLRETPESLAEAIGLLGLRRFHQAVVLSAVRPLLDCPLRAYGLAEGELWDHSLRTALATREVLRELGQRPCEEAFLAAILHDVGKPVLASLLEGDPVIRFDRTTPEELGEAERRATGMDHAEAGGLLLERWTFPSWLVAAVQGHHDPDPSSFLITDLVHLADRISTAAASGRDLADSSEDLSQELGDRWNLSRLSILRIADRSFRFPTDIPEPRRGGKER